MYSKLELIGNVGNDARINHVNGKTAINVSIAINNDWVDSDGVVHEETLWVDCVKWLKDGKDSTFKKLKKGETIFVVGDPKVEAYSKNGDSFAKMKCIVREWRKFSKNKNESDLIPEGDPLPPHVEEMAH